MSEKMSFGIDIDKELIEKNVTATPEDNFTTISLFWSVYLRAAHPELASVMTTDHITAKDVAIMMALLKTARIATGNSPDSFVDLAGYAACACEITTKQNKSEEVSE